MFIKRILKYYTLFALLLFHVVELKAQTHAEATSQKWKGIDVNTVIGNSQYNDDNSLEHGFPFLLFNVGTGRFIMQGGDWAMEGRLFFSDFGRQMYLYSNGRINAAITESQSVRKNSFCARPPEPFGKNWKADINKSNLTTLMDGDNRDTYPMTWSFKRVEDSSDTTSYTYYMYQTSTKLININAPEGSGSTYNGKPYGGMNFYLGAAWGECHNSSVGKGDGQFVFLDDDRSCWTTAEVRGNTNKLQLENGDEIEIQKLYQWQLISVDEFIKVLTQNEVGLNPSISSLVKDRDFTRNSNDFYGDLDWMLSPLKDYTYETGTKRYTYTWGDYKKGESSVKYNNQQYRNPRTLNEPWDSPVKLKEVFDAWYNSEGGMKNAKYGFLPFEGVGTITTNFVAPKPGWYEIECTGFSMSENDHDAYLFARLIPDSRVNDLENTFDIPSSDQPHYGIVTLEKVPFGKYQKDSYNNCLVVGKELLEHRDDHRQKVWVLVSENDFDNGNKTIRLGFRKDQATKSNLTSGGYYDTDWVCVDDIRVSYMGLGPVFFYEDEEDLNYLSHDEDYRQRFLANEYVPAQWVGRYSGAASLQRKFTKDEWNTFSFPLPLTGEQVRHAFGDNCELLKLNSIGNLSKNDCIIDFETVNLLTLDDVVTAGNIYMLKPTITPADGENPRGVMAIYYDLGKMFFSTNANDRNNSDYKYPFLDLSVWNGQQEVGSYKSKNDGCGHVTYIQTPNFETFRVDINGTKLPSVTSSEGSYAPKGSYAMSGGKMYELSRDTRIKGFRGWITLSHSIFDDPSSFAVGARIAIDGVLDGDDTTGIDRHAIVPVNPNAITAVFDLSGRKVGESVDCLPKGLYIVNGKKLLVK